MSDYLYQIGDVLMHRGEEGDLQPARLFVVQRRSIECPGGTQRSYQCRVVPSEGWAHAADWTLQTLNEVELMPWRAGPEAK